MGLAQLQHRNEGGHHLRAAPVAPEQGAEPGDPQMDQPLNDLGGLFGHRIGLPAHNALKSGHRRGQLVVRAGQNIPHGFPQILPWVDVAVGPVGLEGLGGLCDKVPAIAELLVQQGDDLFDFQIVFVALMGLQGGNELFHLAHGLLVVDGQEHPGLDIHQMGGHGNKLTGYLQIQLLALVHPGQVLVQDQGDLDVLDLHFVFAQQVQNKV